MVTAGYTCEHVNFLGLSGQKDWQLMRKVQSGEYTFVTNNRTDFAALFTQEEMHAGLVIVPNVPPAQQRALFQATLSHIAGRDLIKLPCKWMLREPRSFAESIRTQSLDGTGAHSKERTAPGAELKGLTTS